MAYPPAQFPQRELCVTQSGDVRLLTYRPVILLGHHVDVCDLLDHRQALFKWIEETQTPLLSAKG